MTYQRAVPWPIVASIVIATLPVFGEEKQEAKKPAGSPVHEVKAERFKSSVKLKATFESPRLKEIIVEPEEWKELTVRKVVPHGKRVKKGEVILAFETKALKEKIAESDASQRTAKLTLQQSADEFQHLEHSTPLKLEAASTKRRQEEEALAYFEDVQLEQNRESARRSLESAEFSLEYAQEELNQLEKMYKEDNLTEETEEIILKRTRRGVESAKRSLANRKLSTERTLKTGIPRQHKALKAAAETAVLEHKLARASLPRTLELKKRELEKAKKAHKKSSKAFSKLKKDLEMMTVKAPMDGYVFYGAYVDGKWATAAAVAKKLLPGGSVAPKERILTIAQADGLRLRALVPENQLGLLTKGKKGVAVPVAFPGERLPAKLTALSMIESSGGYPAEITLKSLHKQLTPGMHAEVSFVAFESEEAITVPNTAVHQDGKGHYVMLVKDGEKDERREVTVGFTDGKKTVIKRGLSGEIKFVQTDWSQRCAAIVLALGVLASASSALADSTLPELEPVAALGNATIDQAIDRGVDFLLKVQNKNGSWGSATQTKGLNIYAPIPGAHRAFRAAVTANCLAALIETGAIDSNPDAGAAAKRAEDWLLRYLPKVRRATGDAIYNVWAHAYGTRTLALLLEREKDPTRQEQIREAIKEQYDLLSRYESVDGGWGYYDFRYQTAKPSSSSISFTSATALIAFAKGKQVGVEPPEKIVKRAVASIQRQRKPDNSYAYGEYLKMSPMRGINLPSGSLGRSQACNLALRKWGDATITLEVLDTWLDRLWARNGWLDIGRKRPVPHESWQQVAGYFYYYGHYYAALCIEELPPKDAKVHQDHLATILLKLQEKNGCWWDFPFYNYHQQYGTAYALMSLARCRTQPKDEIGTASERE